MKPGKVFKMTITRRTVARAMVLVRDAEATSTTVPRQVAGADFETVAVSYDIEQSEEQKEALPPPLDLVEAYRNFVAARAADQDFSIATLPSYDSWLAVQQIRILENFALTYGLEPEELDGLVHDAKNGEASEINNGGIASQLEYLVAFNGYEAARQLLLEALDMHDAEWPEELIIHDGDDYLENEEDE
jgi:hypothetical protein